ncbi:MAG: glycosyltransferase [Balneolaceae bacterium]
MKGKTRVLIIGKVWPEPDSSAAGSRMVQLIHLFKSQDWEVIFTSAAGKSEYTVNLGELGVKEADIRLNDSSFDIFIKELNPEIVLFDRFMTEEQFGWRVAENCPNALRILDTEDLHCLRMGRHQALKSGRAFSNSDLITEHSKREIASIYRCDLSLIISSKEMEILTSFFRVDDALLIHLPFMLEQINKEKTEQWLPFEKRNHFISIGNFLHEPNWDAVLFLKNEIWSKIRDQLPNTELHVYGAYPSEKVFQLQNKKEGFIVKGRAENVEEVMGRTRVCLAPLRFGAGLKGKLIDAMQYGTPSVVSDIGREGMTKGFEWPGVIQNEPGAFAKSAVELYQNKELWNAAQSVGQSIINSEYFKNDIGQTLVFKIKELVKNLSHHRQNNFTGAMLHHHSMASTKFMSRWIEEKNK